MDSANNRDNLFSRGPTPPPPSQHFQFPTSQSNDSHVSPAPSIREPVQNTSSSHLDSLFHNLSSPSATTFIGAQQNTVGPNAYAGPQDLSHSGPTTPASVNAGSVTSSISTSANPVAERQNALLSLLGGPAPAPAANAQQMTGAPLPPHQIPTPPGSASRPGMSSNESQGKLLLEQLMSGSTPKYASDSQRPPYSVSDSSSPYITQETPYHPDADYHGTENTYNMSETSRENTNFLQSTANQSQRQPSPARRSMFDFVSPFDALASTSSSPPGKRKPAPPSQQANISSSNEDSSWTSVSIDPKRKSVENLMDQLTRGQVPNLASNSSLYDSYTAGEETVQAEPVQSRAPRPLPPQPQPNASPRTSPPKPAGQGQGPPRQQRRSANSPVGAIQGSYGNMSNRDKEGSPLPVHSYRGGAPEGRGRSGGPKGKTVLSPSAQTQNIIVDVSQPLAEIQAPLEAVKSTAIALVKVDSTFLPGTTIGATHWVAYAMTKGRVRVISRSSGDRTLLQLPSLFPPSTAVSDMSVHGNRLAGITSDGGFVVWELPEIITDDVPGQIMLCVLPPTDIDRLHAVKWHPQRPDLLAVASDTNLYLLNIADAAHIFGGEAIPQTELHRVGTVFSVPSPVIAFDFDVPHDAIATISEDSTLTMWNIRDKLPFWSYRIRGDDLPSSLSFVEGGIVVGRRNGTVFQLLSIMGRSILSVIKFINGVQDDPDMFGHANYDSRIQTLWIANNRRDSMMAFKISFDLPTPSPGGDDIGRGAFFDQVVEFSGPKPTIHFVILTADADPSGEEARAACVAAKVPIGELALVAFSVHSSGVDQVLIRSEWFTSALISAPSKFPAYSVQHASPDHKALRPQPSQIYTGGAPVAASQPPAPVPAAVPARVKTPPSEEVEAEATREETRPEQKGKGKGGGGKSVGWKDDNGKEKDVKSRGNELAVINESPLGTALSKEIRKLEESLHTRIGRLMSKELDKQHQRLEDARAHEQAADFVRQEKILKLISTELTKNTTRVVELAVKDEVRNSVLPSLENITRNEVKNALNNQISKGLSESMKQSLPNEIERLLLRPDMSSHIARTFTSAITPLVERQVKDTITKAVIPAYTQQSSAMHQEMSREIRSEILNLKKEVVTWQSEALRGQESLIREMEQSIRVLSDQVKFLSMNMNAQANLSIPSRNSPAPPGGGQMSQGNLTTLLRHQTLPPVTQQSNNYPQPHPAYQQQQPQQQQQAMHGPWFGPNIAAPQASHPTAPPPIPPQQMMHSSSPLQSEEWDDTYLAVLGMQDTRQLRELLARSNPEVVMPLNGNGPLSQAVVLTLVHRLTAVIGEIPPADESFKSTMWWLQRAASTLNTTDPLISPYIARVLPNVQQMLNTTKQRLAIIPGQPVMDTARTISDVQDILARKPM